MGYYSEVAIALKRKDFIKLMQDAIKAAKAEEKYKYVLPLLINGYMPNDDYSLYGTKYETCEAKMQEIIQAEQNAIGLTKRDCVILHWDSVKWYYDDAKWIERAFGKFDYHEFVRIGESDMEEYHNTEHDYLIEPYCTISINNY